MGRVEDCRRLLRILLVTVRSLRTGESQPPWLASCVVWLSSVLSRLLQFASTISKVQLKMLQITSHVAEQSLTLRCRNLDTLTKHPTFKGFGKRAAVTPELLSNGCKVRGHWLVIL